MVKRIKRPLIECARCCNYVKDSAYTTAQYFPISTDKYKHEIVRNVVFEHPICDRCAYLFKKFLTNNY